MLTKIAEHLGVQYIYYEAARKEAAKKYEAAEKRLPEANAAAENLDPDLSFMPAEWIAKLHEAAIAGFDDRILQLVQQIPPDYSHLSSFLTHWATNYQFEAITRLTQPLIARGADLAT